MKTFSADTSSSPSSCATLARRLTFTTESAEQQFQCAMKSVQQYLRSHIPADQLDLLGVNDTRSRYYYEEIQQYLAHRVKNEQQMKQQSQTQQRLQRKDSELLDNLDEFLDELDPALFDSVRHQPTASADTQQFSSQLKRSCSYIKQMQEDAYRKKQKVVVN